MAAIEARNRTYACRCSRSTLTASQLSEPGSEPVYSGTCRRDPEAALGPHALRFAIPEEQPPVEFEDTFQGRYRQDCAKEAGDFVIRRRNGQIAYHLATVVDDAEQGVTEVVRGADLMPSTPRQILLQELLAYPTPRYLHIPVATHADGQKLSKQNLAAPVDLSRPLEALANALKFLGQAVTEGYRPAAVVEAAAKCWNPSGISRQYTQAVQT